MGLRDDESIGRGRIVTGEWTSTGHTVRRAGGAEPQGVCTRNERSPGEF
jgi:hypothetical protein